jgi:hypothetical protein
MNKVEIKKEKFSNFICQECKSAKHVCYDSKGGYCHEDIYFCSKCNTYFIVSAICDKCNNPHSRSYGCGNPKCECEDYHYDHETEEVEVE